MTSRFKLFAMQVLVVAAAALAISVFPSTMHAAPAATSVEIGNFTFKSPIVTVKPGTTVTWINGDDIPHTVVSTTGAFKSKVLDSGDHFSFTFAKPGKFGYFCSLHPHMTGTIVVTA